MTSLETIGKNAKMASVSLATASENAINDALVFVAEQLKKNRDLIKAENKIDVDNARKNGKTDAFIDRLTLTDKVIDDVADGIVKVSKLTSPSGKTIYSYNNEEQGIRIIKKNVPFGVVGMIYESRPNVTADAFALCFKTSNAVILKGGSDAMNSNAVIVRIIRNAIKEFGFNPNCVSLIEDTSRETTLAFMKLNKYVDLLFPRGGAGLIKSALENSTVPIIETGTGVCHAYVDEFADKDMAVKIIFNAKTQRYSVCNALESVVVHSSRLNDVLPAIYDKLSEKSVEMRCDERAYAVLCGRENVVRATEEDFYTEYGGPAISVKTVDSVEEAIAHINEHGTHHSDTIITANENNARKFLEEVDSSAVYHNASTRFTDGFVFGLGAEIGISTQKLHARGPMGLDALVTTKYFVEGDGAVRK